MTEQEHQNDSKARSRSDKESNGSAQRRTLRLGGMDETAQEELPPIVVSSFLKDEQRRELFSNMLRAREFDMAMLRLYRQGRAFGGVYSQIGNEATAVGSAYALRSDDPLFPMHRDIGAHFVRGQDIDTLMRNHLARTGSLMRGTDGTGHYADPDKRIYGNVSHLAAMIPVAAGFALAARMKDEDLVALTYIGDGGAQVGDFHEALNLAAVQKLPLVLVIENNQWAYSTPNSEQFACEKLADRAAGYGIFGETVDGTDIEQVYKICRRAVDFARSGGGPALIETVSMRMRGHAEHDDASYVPEEMFAYWRARDPIERYKKFLVERKVMSAEEIEEQRNEIAEQMNRAIDAAMELPFPPAEEGRKNVFI